MDQPFKVVQDAISCQVFAMWMFGLSTKLITKGKLSTIKRFEC